MQAEEQGPLDQLVAEGHAGVRRDRQPYLMDQLRKRPRGGGGGPSRIRSRLDFLGKEARGTRDLLDLVKRARSTLSGFDPRHPEVHLGAAKIERACCRSRAEEVDKGLRRLLEKSVLALQ